MKTNTQPIHKYLYIGCVCVVLAVIFVALGAIL